MKKIGYITVGPKDFIHGPYIKCPKCNKDSFGVLSIHSHSYTRRCRECYFPKGGETPVRYKLPLLNKKIVYLDQNIISEMMKTLNPKTSAYQKGCVPKFWKDIFEKIDELVKLQLIICPDSSFHRHESLLSPYYDALRRMYEHLSYNISFKDHDTIHRFQLICQFRHWLGQKSNPVDVCSVTRGEINGWQDHYIISLSDKGWPELIDELRNNKEVIVRELLPVFEMWQRGKNRDFNYWHKEEVRGHAELIVSLYKRQLENYVMAMTGASIKPGLLFPDMATTLIYQMKDILRDGNTGEVNEDAIIMEFFRSDDFAETAHVKLASMLWATVAKKAAAGQKRPPNKGFMTDVNIISTVLPYCDVMFVDDVCRSYLMEGPLADEVAKYKAKIFSNRSKDAFLDCLSEIKDSASPEHLNKVEEVYGPGWGEPFVELYIDRSTKR